MNVLGKWERYIVEVDGRADYLLKNECTMDGFCFVDFYPPIFIPGG